MNLIVLKNNLKEGLSIISGTHKENSNLPVLKNFLLEAFEDKLKISSTDLEIGVSYIISAKIIQDGSVTIPYSVFSQIIYNLTSERINLETKGSSILITTDNYKAKISTTPKDDYPIIPEIKENKKSFFQIDTVYFIESISSVFSACQVSDIRPELGGIFFVYKGESINLAATDSFRLAEKTIPSKKFEADLKNEASYIIPFRTVQELIKIFSSKTDGKMKIYFENNQVFFEENQILFVSRLIEGKFPDYELVIPKNFNTEVIIDKNDLSGALKLAGSLSNRLNEVKFVTDESLKNITILSSSQEFGESEYVLPAKIKGESARVTFNWKFVLDGLKNIKQNNVFFGFNGEEKPSLIKSPDDPSYLYIVMPIKSS